MSFWDIVFFVVGAIVTHLLFRRTMPDKDEVVDPDDIDGAIAEKNKQIRFDIEHHSGQYYAWNSDTSEFIVQAKSKNELVEQLVDKYPATKIWVREKRT